MKLLKCYVENFGKLSDFEWSFTDGVNLINEPNGWGKSTFAAFLKAMFYGCETKKDKETGTRDRDQYRPWQGGSFGGSVDFVADGRSYRVMRTFGKTEKGDEFHLYDLNTMLESDAFSENLGEELFDLDAASFKRSIYIAQNDCRFAASDSIHAKLGNLAENTNDINNFESAILMLKNRMNSLTPDRATGSTKKRQKRITELGEELKSYSAAGPALEELERKLELYRNQRTELSKIRKDYADSLELASQSAVRNKLLQEHEGLKENVAELESRLDEYRGIFRGEVPGEDLFREAWDWAGQVETLQNQLMSLNLTEEEQAGYDQAAASFDRLHPTMEEMEEKVALAGNLALVRQNAANLRQQKEMLEANLAQKMREEPQAVKGWKGLLRAGYICEAAGIVGAVVGFLLMDRFGSLPIGPIAGGILILVGIVLLILSAKREKKERLRTQTIEENRVQYQAPIENLCAQYEAIQTQAVAQENDLRTYLEQMHVFCPPEAYQTRIYELRNRLADYDRMTDQVLRLREVRDRRDQARERLADVYQRMGIAGEHTGLDQLAQYRTQAGHYRMIQEQLQAAQAKLTAFETEHGDLIQGQPVTCPYTLDELNRMITDVDRKMEEIRTTVNQLDGQMASLREQLDLASDKEAELADLKELQEQELHKYQVLARTSEFLNEAKESFATKYMGPISEGFAKYYDILLGSVNRDWQVNAHMELQVKEQGNLRDTSSLSAGYRDLVDVCMRLALVDAMYREEKPFLILDDPFVNLDGGKLAHGKALMDALGREYQTIYFTCHESRNLA